jgi:hypothetical protein
MSVEQLLFFLLLVALPLLERLIRSLRVRTDQSQGAGGPAVPDGSVSRPPPIMPVPDVGGTAAEEPWTESPAAATPLPRPVRHTVRPTAPEPRGFEHAPRVRRDRPHRPAASRRGDSAAPMRPVVARPHLVLHGDIRRAIVLMAVMGPCRALTPNDESPRS